MTFTLASYNILADSYLNPAWYPGTEPALLEPARRYPALVERIAQLATDVLCLQEVELDVYGLLTERLTALGYEGNYASKGAGKPDGCATFHKTTTLPLRAVRTLHYADGAGNQLPSGHLALITLVVDAGRQVGIVNTHLKWDPPGTAPRQQVGLRQIRELLAARTNLAPGCATWIICGDLNVSPNSEVVRLLQAAGFQDAYATQPQAFTCNANRNARRLDFMFHSSDLTAVPAVLPCIDHETPLPSADQPSDHLAISARFAWATPRTI